jgi:hypothetical protein
MIQTLKGIDLTGISKLLTLYFSIYILILITSSGYLISWYPIFVFILIRLLFAFLTLVNSLTSGLAFDLFD